MAMQAKAYELPLRCNYFAEADYLRQDLAAGTLQNRAGTRMVALADDLLIALVNAIAQERGEQSGAVLAALGRDWGTQAAAQFTRELGDHHATPLAEQPLAVFAADLTAAFLHHGWGRFQFDFSRFARGLLLVDVTDPFLGSSVRPTSLPVEGLLAGFLGGMFSHFAGIELAGLQTACRANGAEQSRFVLTVPARLAAVAGWVEAGRGHDEILSELEKSPLSGK